jgi:hypothetical protein
VSSDLDSLRYTVDDMKRTVDDLETEDLPEKVRGVRYDLTELGEKVDSVETDLSSDIGDGKRLLKRLASRVEWLERHIRQSPDTETVSFDDDTQETRKLIRAVELGLNAEATLLTAARRQGLEAAISRYQAAVQHRDTQRQAVLAAAEILAASLPQKEQHSQAAAAFKAAVPKARQAQTNLPTLAEAATEARAELAEDDTQRAGQILVISAGQKSAKKLRWQMRGRLADALNQQLMLPTWFITVLGPLPPAKDTDAWMDTATDVLVYRATYQITDPIVALGSPPGGPPTRRFARYERLKRELRRWDR